MSRRRKTNFSSSSSSSYSLNNFPSSRSIFSASFHFFFGFFVCAFPFSFTPPPFFLAAGATDCGERREKNEKARLRRTWRTARLTFNWNLSSLAPVKPIRLAKRIHTFWARGRRLGFGGKSVGSPWSSYKSRCATGKYETCIGDRRV